MCSICFLFAKLERMEMLCKCVISLGPQLWSGNDGNCAIPAVQVAKIMNTQAGIIVSAQEKYGQGGV